MADKSFGVKELRITGTGTPTIESPGGGNLNINAATSTFSGTITGTDGLTISGITTITPSHEFSSNPGSSKEYTFALVDTSNNTQYAANVGVAKTLYHRYGGITFDDYYNEIRASRLRAFKYKNLNLGTTDPNNNNRMHLRLGSGGSNSGGDASLPSTNNESIALFECNGNGYITIASGTGSATRAGVLFANSNGAQEGAITYKPSAEALRFHIGGNADSTVRLAISDSGVNVTGVATFSSNIDAASLPTSDPNVAGRIWRSGNDLKISTG